MVPRLRKKNLLSGSATIAVIFLKAKNHHRSALHAAILRHTLKCWLKIIDSGQKHPENGMLFFLNEGENIVGLLTMNPD